MLVIVLSARTKESLVPSINNDDFSLDQLGNDNELLDKSSLFDEGHQCMRKLLDYILSTHISSVNLISSICVLSNVAKQRPEYMSIVLETCQKIISRVFCLFLRRGKFLHNWLYTCFKENMPPTLGKSQVSTVRKQMKLQIIAICKNPCCLDYHAQIVQILTELGTSNNEVIKYYMC